jgi:hypothetical protein
MNVLYDKVKGTPYCPGKLHTKCKGKQTGVRHKAVELETCSSEVLYVIGLCTVLQYVILITNITIWDKLRNTEVRVGKKSIIPLNLPLFDIVL